ncbi:MAG: oxalate/formate MFS antiporter [Sulfolobales archaeon]
MSWFEKVTNNRWVQLIAGFIAMVVISNYQYAFTYFKPGIQAALNAGSPEVVAIYSLFIAFETWPVPVGGYLVDRFGIRRLMILGSIMIAIGWIGTALTNNLFLMYLFYGAIAGTGAGIIYISTVGNAVKWFPDRRGLAAGITAAGFGGGASITIIPFTLSISSIGWRTTMLIAAIIQGIIAFAMALILKHPPQEYVTKFAQRITESSRVLQTAKNYSWHEAIRRPEFWLMYIMFVMTATGGLMAVGNLTDIAKFVGVGSATILGISVAAVAGTITGVTNALARIAWGGVSDRLGRENTMTIAFLLEAALVFLITTTLVKDPVLFTVILGVAYLAWGEIFSLYSALTADAFGPKYASANYGILYTAKGVASQIAGWGAALIASISGTWTVPIYISVIFDIIAAILAIAVLKPMIRRRIKVEITKGVGKEEKIPQAQKDENK